MTASKTALTASSLAFALIFGGGLYLYMNLGAIAERMAEKLASQTLGVDVSMSKLDISLQDRRAVVHNLRVANAPGFMSDDAVTVSEISITLGNVTQDLVVFKDINVSKMAVNLDMHEDGSNNLQAIKANIKTAPADESSVKAPNVTIDRTAIEGALLMPHSALTDQNEALQSFTIPDIVLNGIGSKPGGVTAQEAVAEVWKEIVEESQQAAARRGIMEGLLPRMLEDSDIPDNIKEGIGGVLKGFGQ